jgi:CBS domain-containing protein
MSAIRYCNPDVDVISPDDSVQTAAGRMHARKVGSLVVIDRERMPVGIITDRDICVRLAANGKDAAGTSVHEIMTPCPETVREQASLEDALRRMRAGAFRRLPVVSAREQLVGLLSLDDVLRVFAHDFCQIERLMQRESPEALAEIS